MTTPTGCVRLKKVTASDLYERLREKHAKDLLVEGCAIGSRQAGARELDAWVMKRTWSPMRFIGYEIKVSRSDFLRDQKWHEYLDVCHEFYFVCPRGLIQPEELPGRVGLMWHHGSTRLHTKRKAVHQAVKLDRIFELMSYVLMCRTKIVSDWTQTLGTQDKAERWRQLLLEQRGNHVLGHMVSRHVAERLREAERERFRAESENKRLSIVREWLLKLGVDESCTLAELQRRAGELSPYDLRRIRNAAHGILEVIGEQEGA